MFKRILALVLCALMLLGGAMAETAPEAWRVVIGGIEIEKDGQSVVLNPALEVLFGRDDAGVWGQAAVQVNGNNVLAVQGDYAGETARVTAEGAQDVLVVDGVDMLLRQYDDDLSADQLNAMIDSAFEAMANFDDSAFSKAGDADEHLTIERKGDCDYAVTLVDGGETLRLHIVWEQYAGERPFDLAQKNPCAYTFREMTPGDGTDIPDALTMGLMQLLSDESVAAAMELFGDELDTLDFDD